MRLLTEPFSRRTWREMLHAVTDLPISVIGFVYTVALLSVGSGLAVTFLGLPLVATAVLSFRGWGAAARGRARAFLDTDVAAPPPYRRQPGLLGWVRTGLGDAAGWRAGLYNLLKFPTAVATFNIAIVPFATALGAITYPIWYRWTTQTDSHGVVHHGSDFGSYYMDTPPRLAMMAGGGVVLLLIWPWLLHGFTWIDRGLVRGLLGPTQGMLRMQALEETRTQAVDDSAAALRRIERDLHDGAQARLVAMAMNLGLAKEYLDEEESDPARLREMVERAHANAKEAIVELRDLARGIHPPALDRGLDPALATLASRSVVPIELRVELPKRPSPAIETIVYFCAAELITNVAKHSEATRALVSVIGEDEHVVLAVADNGQGGASSSSGSGLAGLKDRVRTVDGSLDVDSPPGGPTVVTVTLPLHA